MMNDGRVVLALGGPGNNLVVITQGSQSNQWGSEHKEEVPTPVWGSQEGSLVEVEPQLRPGEEEQPGKGDGDEHSGRRNSM